MAAVATIGGSGGLISDKGSGLTALMAVSAVALVTMELMLHWRPEVTDIRFTVIKQSLCFNHPALSRHA